MLRLLRLQSHRFKYISTASYSGRYRKHGGKNRNVSSNNLSKLIKPLNVRPVYNPDDMRVVSKDLTGRATFEKSSLSRILSEFYRRPSIKQLASNNGLEGKLLLEAFVNFRRFCVETAVLPPELHIVVSDILQGAVAVDELWPYFLQHTHEMFPHLQCMDELKKISDLTLPPNWYPEARSLQRKIVFHAGETNSGKTYQALTRFLESKTGVYCGPLRLLAHEVFAKANKQGTACDLVTGEERRYAFSAEDPAEHVACTVEMCSVSDAYEVAVIDEIQMMSDQQRGWAWTRALLGLNAQEIHVCGEASAIDLVQELMFDTGDEVEVRKYKRLTPLIFQDKALNKLDNVRDGDAIVCFSKNSIYQVSRQLESIGKQCAVIYGTLPLSTKLSQAARFNNPDDPANILVATDAIGMGLNLNIRRIVFSSLVKPTINSRGEKEIDVISTSTALQISGRAGRFGMEFEEEGQVTTLHPEDLLQLRKIISKSVPVAERAGLSPTAEQIELFAYHLPKATLSNLIDIFLSISQIDNSKYFMCNYDDFKSLADIIEHVPLSIRVRYVLCCAPINLKHPYVTSMFLRVARQISLNTPITAEWICQTIGWPLTAPQIIEELFHLEGVYDVLDFYLWLSYRFTDLFPHGDAVRDLQKELNVLVDQGVVNITELLRNYGKKSHVSRASDEDSYQMNRRQIKHRKIKKSVLPQAEEAAVRKESLVPEMKATKSKNESVLKSRLGDKLVREGILTEKMLSKLEREWKNSLVSGDENFDNDNSDRPNDASTLIKPK